jgi:hypothetical protein
MTHLEPSAPPSGGDLAPRDAPRKRVSSSRRVRAGEFAVGAFFHGLGLLVVIYVTGLLFLLGDYRVELYVLLGVLAGGLLFPTVGVLLLRWTGRPLVWGFALALVVGIGLTVVNSLDPLFSNPDLFVRSTGCTVLGTPIAIVTVPRCARRLR